MRRATDLTGFEASRGYTFTDSPLGHLARTSGRAANLDFGSLTGSITNPNMKVSNGPQCHPQRGCGGTITR